MRSFSSNSHPTDQSAKRVAAFECQLELYAFLVADRCLLSMDEATQDGLIKLLYALGKPLTIRPGKP